MVTLEFRTLTEFEFSDPFFSRQVYAALSALRAEANSSPAFSTWVFGKREPRIQVDGGVCFQCIYPCLGGFELIFSLSEFLDFLSSCRISHAVLKGKQPHSGDTSTLQKRHLVSLGRFRGEQQVWSFDSTQDAANHELGRASK